MAIRRGSGRQVLPTRRPPVGTKAPGRRRRGGAGFGPLPVAHLNCSSGTRQGAPCSSTRRSTYEASRSWALRPMRTAASWRRTWTCSPSASTSANVIYGNGDAISLFLSDAHNVIANNTCFHNAKRTARTPSSGTPATSRTSGTTSSSPPCRPLAAAAWSTGRVGTPARTTCATPRTTAAVAPSRSAATRPASSTTMAAVSGRGESRRFPQRTPRATTSSSGTATPSTARSPTRRRSSSATAPRDSSRTTRPTGRARASRAA